MNRTDHSSSIARIGLFVALICTPAFALQSDRTMLHFEQPASGMRGGAPRDIPALPRPNRGDLFGGWRSDSRQVMQESWTVQQGAPDYIQSMAQTADGFLWLGGPSGLFRFDGTRFERFHAPSGDQLLSTNLISIFAPSTGGLWVGYEFGGFSFINNGRVKNYGRESGASTGTVNGFAQDPDGVIWAGTVNGVWRFEGPTWRHLGAEWNAPSSFTRLAFDRSGTLWALEGYSKQTLIYMLPGSKRFRVADENPIGSGFTRDADQMVMTSPITRQHVANSTRNPDDGLIAFPIFRKDSQQIVDRRNSVWIMPRGPLMRIQASEPLSDVVTKANSGSSETYDVHPYNDAWLVDREGNVWFSDDTGIHRFFYAPFTRLNLSSVKGPFAIAADDDGGMWVGAWGTSVPDLYHLANGKIDTLHVPNSGYWMLAYRAADKTFWFAGAGGLWHLVHGKLVRIALPKEMSDQSIYLQVITSDRAGGVWVSFTRRGLYRYEKGVWTLSGGRRDFPRPDVVSEFTDSLGRVWFGYTRSQLAVLDGDRVQVFLPSDGIRVGTITAIYGRGSQIWIGGEFGLQQFDNGRFHTIGAVNDDWLLGISGIVETPNGDLWLNGLSGIFHISRAEISLALNDPSYRVKGEHFGNREGLPGFAAQIRPLPSVVEGSDGRLWFSVTGGLVWLDPTRPQEKAIAPPITIQSVSADDRPYDPNSQATFPAHTSSVRIEYAAISLSDPEAIRFRGRLLETDPRWHEVSTASPVMYRNLPPGQYHFTVGASDTNGVWSDKMANVNFTILPAWYQTNSFRACSVWLFLLLLWALYQLRLKQLERHFNITIQTRVDERTRIARELHDTLLQSFQGITLLFQRARNLLPERAPEAIKTLDKALDGAERAIVEGRDAIHDLRSPAPAARVLAEEITAFGDELVAKDTNEKAQLQFRMVVEGSAHALDPKAHIHIFRIAREAMRNASSHSQGRLIEAEIAYTDDLFRLRIRDDGKGIDPNVQGRAERTGHWGLKGMRERAQRLGGELDVWSEPGAGTEIEFRIPGSTVYAAASSRGSFQPFWKRRKNDDA